MALPKSVAICSFRLGGTDGVSIEAHKWSGALAALGCTVRTVAGSGPVDVLVPGLALGLDEIVSPSRPALEDVFADMQLVIVENLCSLPLRPGASEAVAALLAGRPAILHHHDLASERPEFAHFGPPPNDPAWLHVCVNDRARTELAGLGYRATTCYNAFQADPPLGDRASTRARLGIGPTDRLVLQPTRAIARKNIAGGIALAEALDASYWLTGATEDGYDDALEQLVRSASVPVLREPMPAHRVADAYAACDLVALPSTWEGFGNPALESATHRRPLAIGDYPVARELREFGFRWFDANDPALISRELRESDDVLLEHNAAIARAHFNLADLPGRLAKLLNEVMALG